MDNGGDSMGGYGKSEMSPATHFTNNYYIPGRSLNSGAFQTNSLQHFSL